MTSKPMTEKQAQQILDELHDISKLMAEISERFEWAVTHLPPSQVFTPQSETRETPYIPSGTMAINCEGASGVRVTYLPSGNTVDCSDYTQTNKNYLTALALLAEQLGIEVNEIKPIDIQIDIFRTH